MKVGLTVVGKLAPHPDHLSRGEGDLERAKRDFRSNDERTAKPLLCSQPTFHSSFHAYPVDPYGVRRRACWVPRADGAVGYEANQFGGEPQ